MLVSVDWLSFSFDSGVGEGLPAYKLGEKLAEQLQANYPFFYDRMIALHTFYPKHGRAPYQSSFQREDGGVMVFGHTMLEHSLVEIGGVGCDSLGGVESEIDMACYLRDRLTRIDIAVDIHTDVKPSEYVAYRVPGRFKSHSSFKSVSGETEYVGSRTSDRYARVYRYNEPHPRAALLRVEHVLKGEQAKEFAAALGSNSLNAMVARLGNTFGWNHPVWLPEESSEETIKAWRPERRKGKTVSWIYSQVIPALVGLHNDNILDLHQVFREDILPLIDKHSNL